jgi:energy-coupling factor transport system permease protein
MLFLLGSLWSYLFLAVCLAAVVRCSKVPVRYMLRGLRSIVFIVAFTSLLNLFFSYGDTLLFSFWVIKITLESLILSVRMIARLVLLLMGTSLLTLTTTPIELTDAIEFILRPFKRIGLPSHEIAMMMTIALRFIPTLLNETDKIMKAQTARGASFDTGGIVKRAKSLLPLLIPLFISAFRRADELATAMEARCYRGDVGRTRMKIMKIKRPDYVSMLSAAAFSAAVLLLNRL